jgi:hypothetical protein
MLARLAQWVATATAFLAPVAIVHWILIALNLPETIPLVQMGQGFFHPMNDITTWLLPFEPPSVFYEERNVSTLQAFSAIVFIGVFFLLVALAEGLKKLDKQWRLADSQHQQEQKRKVHLAEKEKQRQQHANAQEILLLIQFPFFEYPQLGMAFRQYDGYGGRELPSDPNTLAVGFMDVDKALIYAKQVRKLLLEHYQTLAPAEAKPHFSMTLHAHQDPANLHEALSVCLQLGRYANSFGVIVSQALQKLLVARGKAADHPNTSLGFYLFPNGQDEEVFKLVINDAHLTGQLY